MPVMPNLFRHFPASWLRHLVVRKLIGREGEDVETSSA